MKQPFDLIYPNMTLFEMCATMYAETLRRMNAEAVQDFKAIRQAFLEDMNS